MATPCFPTSLIPGQYDSRRRAISQPVASSPTKDAAIVSFVSRAAQDNPADTMKWVGTMSDQKLQAKAFMRTARQWTKQDPRGLQPVYDDNHRVDRTSKSSRGQSPRTRAQPKLSGRCPDRMRTVENHPTIRPSCSCNPEWVILSGLPHGRFPFSLSCPRGDCCRGSGVGRGLPALCGSAAVARPNGGSIAWPHADRAGLAEIFTGNLGRDFSEWPPKSWDFETLNWVALYYNPALQVARAQWAGARGSIVTGAERPNPSVNFLLATDSNPPWHNFALVFGRELSICPSRRPASAKSASRKRNGSLRPRGKMFSWQRGRCGAICARP